MPTSVVKVAVTVPADLFREVEGIRKQRAQSRSGMVQEALRQWLRSQKQAVLVREYEAGYRRRPESEREVDEALATSLGLLHDDDEPW
jgi:metal-responsive CopG/Arc/MetJ family transcriptional regulator